MLHNVNVQDMHQISVPKDVSHSYVILNKPKQDKVTVMLEGALLPLYYSNLSTHSMSVYIQIIVVDEMPSKERDLNKSNIILHRNVSDVWNVPIVNEKLIGMVPEIVLKKVFKLSPHKIDNTSYHLLQIKIKTNLNTNFPVSLGYNLQPINTEDGIYYAALVLLGLYIMIISEVVHRTLAAILASTMSVAILAAFNARPTMSEIISWIDVETLLLLFSMMTLVTILSETGIFDYMSVLAYKVSSLKRFNRLLTCNPDYRRENLAFNQRDLLYYNYPVKFFG